MGGVERLIDRWMNEPQFREALRRNPEDAVRQSGVTLSEDEWAALLAIDWSASDEELQTRVSRGT